MSEEIKIDKDIPLPKTGRTGITETLKKLDIGDSFITSNFRNIHAIAHQCKIKVASQRQPDGTYRIWRKS